MIIRVYSQNWPTQTLKLAAYVNSANYNSKSEVTLTIMTWLEVDYLARTINKKRQLHVEKKDDLSYLTRYTVI